MVEFDSPAVGGGTVRQSGRFLEKLPNGKVKVEILVGGDPTYKIVTPAGEEPAPAPRKEPRKRKAKAEPKVPEIQLDLFGSVVQGLKEELEKLKARLQPEDEDTTTEDDLTEDSVVRPEYYDLVRLGPHPKYRVIDRHKVKGRGRHYVVQFEEGGKWGRPQFYLGVTSIADAVLPTPVERIEWYCGFPSHDHALEELDALATKGTVMHSLFAHCAMGMLPDFGTHEWEKHLKLMITKQGYDPKAWYPRWNTFMRKAILSFKQWVEDYRVTFLAIELPLGIPHSVDSNGNKVFGWFGQLDFPVEMDIEPWVPSKLPRKANLPEKPKNGRRNEKRIANGEPFIEMTPPDKDKDWRAGENPGTPYRKRTDFSHPGHPQGGYSAGERDMPVIKVLSIPQTYIPYPDWQPTKEPQRVLAIVDAKSGKHDYEEHDVQLGLQIPLFRHNFPHLKDQPLRVYNWHPVDWQEERAIEKGYFPYQLLDKTNRMDQGVIETYLKLWQMKHAREMPRRIVWGGNPNIGASPSQNVAMVDYSEYYEDLVATAIANKRMGE